MLGRRSRLRPEEVAIDGYLLFDTGEYELVTAYIPLEVFWKMKALDVVGHVRSANRARLGPAPQVGSVWLVDADLEAPATGPINPSASAETSTAKALAAMRPDADGIPAAPGGPGASPPEGKTFRMRVHAVYSLDRVAIEPKGPRFIESLHVRDMLPPFCPD
jgi:hypothetical protein